MGSIDSSWVNDLVAALFCGAFIGMERERSKRDDPGVGPDEPADARNIAGIRTHVLVALLGAICRVLDLQVAPGATPWFSIVGFGGLALFAVAAYGVRASRTGHYGMTSVPTLLVTFGLGVLCLAGQRPIALALAVVITAILAVKIPLHSFIAKLSREELAAAVKFALLALVLLPILPDQDYGPSDWPWLEERLRGLGMSDGSIEKLSLLNPHKLWLLVVLISGVGFVGYVLVRLLGAGRGLVLTGLTGGLVSSTAVTVSMAEKSRGAGQLKSQIAAAVLCACAVMAVRVLVIAAALMPALLLPLLLPIGAMLLAKVVMVLVLARRGGKGKAEDGFRVATPLAVVPALKLAGLLFLVRVVSEVAVLLIGSAGLVVVAAVSGLADVDAITVAAAQQASAGRVGVFFAVSAICTGVAVNTLTKATLMRTMGERETGRLSFFLLVISVAVGAAGFVVVWITGIGRG